MSQARSVFSVSATTLSMLLYRSEFRSGIPVPQRVKLPPVSTAPDRVPRISVRRLASRLPVQRFLDCVLAFFLVTTRPAQRSGLYPYAQDGRGQVRKANTSDF